MGRGVDVRGVVSACEASAGVVQAGSFGYAVTGTSMEHNDLPLPHGTDVVTRVPRIVDGLPEDAPNIAELESWLISVRLREGDGRS
jgi:hypothetical protein